MSLFEHFSSEQIWLVLVATGPGQKTLEHWLAPVGDMGYRKILRQSNPKRRAVAAIALSKLGGLGAATGERGWWPSLLRRMQGPHYALFRMDPDDGLVSLDIKRGKSAEQAEHSGGDGIVGSYLLNGVRDSVRSMRHLLDTQNIRGVHFNLLGKGDPSAEEPAPEMNLKIRPDKWTEPEMGA